MDAGGAASKRRKRRRRGRGVGADRISDLPDAVLGEIVSLLPVREGARTQILASRWRHIWRSAPLNLDCNGLDTGSRRFAGVVSRILSSHQGPGCRFRVSASYIAIPSDPANTRSAVVDAWLRSPALDNLQELDVDYSSERPIHPFSASILRFWTTLRVVSVRNCKLCDSAIQGLHFPKIQQLNLSYVSLCNLSNSAVQGLHFPKLQQLALSYVSILECTLNHMIGGCPALECLMIRRSCGFRCVRINSPSITSIGVVAECYPTTTNDLKFEELIIENAPFLKRLLHCDRSHQSAELHVSVLSAPKLETLGCVLDKNYLSTKLSFGSTIIQGLYADSLTMVVRTVKNLDVPLNHLSLDIVINLMRCFPCLEKLYIQLFQPCRTSEKNLWRRKYRNLARYIDIRLKIIMLQFYHGSRFEINFLTFFVLNAKALESVTLRVYANNDKEEFFAKQSRKLQLENGASRGVRFHFTTRMDASYLADIRCL